jgi:arylformamidase
MAASGMAPSAASRFVLAAPRPADLRLAWEELDDTARGACYDNNAGVPDSAAQVTARNAASAAYRAAHLPGLDIPYAGAERAAFDLYPAAEPAAPCLVFVHGGYWQRNARADFACFAEGLNAAGWSVAMPGYTLAPESSLAGIVAEIGAALDWLAEHGPGHGIGGPVVLSGWSAGAQLAAMHLGHPAVIAGLAISGVYDLAPIRETYLNEKLRLTDEEVATLSPLRLPAVAKPMTIAYGSRELPALVHDARNLHALRADAHAPGALLPVPGADHFSILNGFRRPDGLLVRAARDLLEGASI